MPISAGPATRSQVPPTAADQEPQTARQRVALSFTVRPEAAEEAARVLSGYRAPQTRVDERTRLLGTTVFLGGNRVLRVADISGDIGAALRHLSTQPAVRAVERALDPLLTEPRDMSSPEGARAFFARSALRCAPPRTGGDVPSGAEQPAHRWAALLPVPEGAGPRAVELLDTLRPASVTATTIHRDDVVVWLLEGAEPADRLPAEACADPAVREGWQTLLGHLRPAPGDGGTGLPGPADDGSGLVRLLSGWAMRVITDRRAS